MFSSLKIRSSNEFHKSTSKIDPATGVRERYGILFQTQNANRLLKICDFRVIVCVTMRKLEWKECEFLFIRLRLSNATLTTSHFHLWRRIEKTTTTWRLCLLLYFFPRIFRSFPVYFYSSVRTCFGPFDVFWWSRRSRSMCHVNWTQPSLVIIPFPIARLSAACTVNCAWLPGPKSETGVSAAELLWEKMIRKSLASLVSSCLKRTQRRDDAATNWVGMWIREKERKKEKITHVVWFHGYLSTCALVHTKRESER